MPSPSEPDPRAPVPPALAEPAPTPAQRQRAVDLLTRHYAADRLTDAELQVRLDHVYQAHSVAELNAMLAALPDAPGVAPEVAPVRIRALLSGQEQKLSGVLPRRLELKARLGYVELNLRNARFQEGVTEIDVRVFAGYAEIRLPAGVRVEVVGQALMGYIAIKGGGTAADEGSTRAVRITGRVVCGYTECFRASEGEPRSDEEMKQLEGWWRS